MFSLQLAIHNSIHFFFIIIIKSIILDNMRNIGTHNRNNLKSYYNL